MFRSFALLLLATASLAVAKSIRIAAPADFAAACAQARPGDSLVLEGTAWKDAVLEFKANGTAEAPITLTAADPGKLKLTGGSRLVFAGNHLVAHGLVFTEGYLKKDEAIVSFVQVNGAYPTHCRITECAFIRYNPPAVATDYDWVILRGRFHRVDRCHFEGQNHFGVTLKVIVGREGENRHRIERNYFFNRPPGFTNGFESLQVGQAADAHLDSNSLVEYNLFELCDGEQEIISNKTGGNTYRKNTFLRSAGALTLRHGDRAVVEHNVFLGGGKPHTGGVRMIGRGHVVRANYFHGLSGLPTAGAVISLYAGIPNSVPTGYVEAENAVVADNVLIQNAANGIHLSAGHLSRNRTILPKNISITNNWIHGDPRYGVTVLTGTPAEGLKASGNVYTPWTELGLAPQGGGFKGLWFIGDPDANFPLVPELSAPATEENDGWRATMAALEPLSAEKVGPTWWPRRSGPVGK